MRHGRINPDNYDELTNIDIGQMTHERYVILPEEQNAKHQEWRHQQRRGKQQKADEPRHLHAAMRRDGTHFPAPNRRVGDGRYVKRFG